MTRRILIVDDEASLLEFLSLLFEEEGYQVCTASSMTEARERLEATDHHLILCDILMPDGNGLDLLREIKQRQPHAAVIMMTAYTSTKSAIEAMRLGAYDYISKPFDVEELKVLAEKALEKTELEEQNVYLRRELEGKYTFANIIGTLAQDAGGLLPGRAGRPHRLDRAGPGRERHRQGADRARDPLRQPAGRATSSCRSTAARCPRTCSRASSSATCAAPSPARCARRRACSRRRTRARCSWTRSAR